MWLACLHRQESVDVRAAQEIEERTFDAVREVMSEDDCFDIIFLRLFPELAISPLPEIGFGIFFLACPFDDDELGSFEKYPYELLIFGISGPGSMITMYKI